MNPLLLLAALSVASADTEVFAGVWRLDEDTSDYIPSPDLPTVAKAARSANAPPRSASQPANNTNQPSGRNGQQAGGGGMDSPSEAGSAPTISAQLRRALATRWLIRSGEWLELAGEGEELQIGWLGNTPVSVEMRRRPYRMDTGDIGAPGKGRVKLAARWQPGEIEITREVYGIVLIEHILPPEDDRMAVIVEVAPLVPGMESLWFRREYVRTAGPPPPPPEEVPPASTRSGGNDSAE